MRAYPRVRLSSGTGKYLREVFGYRDVTKIDRLTLECIRENAVDGYPADKEILKVRRARIKAAKADVMHIRAQE